MNLKKLIITVFILLSAVMTAEGKTIKVLIIDNMFQYIPQKDETMSKMGSLTGDLLVNGNHYTGNIEVWKGKAGLCLINEVPVEEYVKSVVGAEVGKDWAIEALKAQAVISRTYALYQQINPNKRSNYDLTSSVLHQVYKGGAVDRKVSDAVKNTKGEVLVYDGKIIEAFYHSTCGGKTEKAEEVFSHSYPYLKSVESSCKLSPYRLWKRRISLSEIEKALNISGIEEIKIGSLTSTKRVKTLDITLAGGSRSVRATELRRLLGWKRLPSTNFNLTHDNDSIIFQGKGYGHGVGLCQWSALEMARKGKSYKDILAFYYPGATIQIYENR